MVDVNGAGHYLGSGALQISLANLVVVAVMGVLFVAALLLPFPGNGSGRRGTGRQDRVREPRHDAATADRG